MIFIDTNVAIALREVDPATTKQVQTLGRLPAISVMTRVELENGVNRDPAVADQRRRLLDRLLRTLAVEYLTPADILAYGRIVYQLGHDRRLTIDRLIAAQAISRDALLITMNGKDFQRIEGLRLEIWSAPA